MRYQLLVAAALLGVAGPAFAQDRTIPTGALDALRAQSEVSAVPTYAGRSVELQAERPPHHAGARHRHSK